jgi:hypothetical protein
VQLLVRTQHMWRCLHLFLVALWLLSLLGQAVGLPLSCSCRDRLRICRPSRWWVWGRRRRTRIVVNQPFRRLLQLRLRQQRLRLHNVEVVELCHAPHLRRLFPSRWSAWGTTRHMRILVVNRRRRLRQQRLWLRGADL